MADYVLSNAADGDLADIYSYSHRRFGEAQADTYFLGLRDCLRMLADNPRLGRSAGTRHQDMLRYAHGGHIIFYRIDTPDIFVIRVPHHSMDSERHIDT